MFLNTRTFSCCALILLGAACLSPRQVSTPSPEAAGEEPLSDEDRKFNERYIKQELGFIREKDERLKRVLAALEAIQHEAMRYGRREIKRDRNDGLSLSEAEVKRLKECFADLNSSEELGLLAKYLWNLRELPPSDENYDYPLEMSFWFCVGRLADRSDEEAEEILYDIFENYANDGGYRLMINDILETRNPGLNHGPLKNFKRDDMITTVPRVNQTGKH